MKAEQIAPFLRSAYALLGADTGSILERGAPVLRNGPTVSSRELTAVATLEGDLTGVLYCSMSLATAAKLQGALISADNPQAAGTIVAAWLLAKVCGEGAEALRQQGHECTPSTPVLVQGFEEPLTNVSPVLHVPVLTAHGDVDLGVALQPAGSARRPETLLTVRPGSSHGLADAVRDLLLPSTDPGGATGETAPAARDDREPGAGEADPAAA